MATSQYTTVRQTDGQQSDCLRIGQSPAKGDDLREFLLVLRQGLLLIVAYIERRYGLTPHR